MSDNVAFSTSTEIARSFARTHRADVQGLRGVAVLLVVLDHTGVLRSGFIGVDVFFAISCFVVVRSLLTAFLGADDGAAAVLSAFYKRRVARLAPALALCE